MSQVASLANVVQINLAMPFCLSFQGVPYYERSQELCSFIDNVGDKQFPEVAGQHMESHHDSLSCGVIKRMYLMCDMVPPSRYHISKMKYVNLAMFPGWSVMQNGVTQTTGFLTQRMIPLWQSDHATAHFFDGQASAVNQQHGFLQVCWVMRMGQLRQLALAHLDLGSEPPISVQELDTAIKLVLAVDTGSSVCPVCVLMQSKMQSERLRKSAGVTGHITCRT